MQEQQFVCGDGETILLQHENKPKHISDWGCVYEGQFRSQKVIIKVTKLKHTNECEDARREKYILEKLQNQDERIFMQLLASIETNDEIFLVLEKASIDLYDFLKQTHKNLSKKESIYIVFLLAKLTNLLHQKGIAHCDISLENIVLYMANGEFHTAFIDAAQAQEPNMNDEFDVNVPGCQECKHFGKQDYETPDACFNRPFKLMNADVFAMKIVMWQIVIHEKPFSILPNTASIGPMERREKFFRGKFQDLATMKQQEHLGDSWKPFCDFLSSSTNSFNIDHELFASC